MKLYKASFPFAQTKTPYVTHMMLHFRVYRISSKRFICRVLFLIFKNAYPARRLLIHALYFQIKKHLTLDALKENM